MATHKIYSGSSWVTGVEKTWTGSVWQANLKFWNGSAWVALAATGPVVSASTTNVSRTSLSPQNCVAGVSFNSNGTEWSTDVGGVGNYIVSRGNWLDSGLSSEVWIQRVINTGGFNYADPGSGRLQLSSTRTFACRDISQFGGAITCNATFNFYDAASGGNLLDSVTIAFSALKEL